MNLMERLRPIVGSKGWDYCLVWKLSEDQRSLEWMGCCCGGAESNGVDLEHEDQNGGRELGFQVSALVPCRDVMFQHPRTKCCDFLALQPSSVILDPGFHLIHAQALISNQPKWLNYSNCTTLESDHVPENESLGTRVLIPVAGGLVELFVAKQVSEDQDVIDFITSQLSMPMDQEALLSQTNIVFNNNVNGSDQKADLDLDLDHHDHDHVININNNNLNNLPYDLSADRIRLSSNSNSPMNFLHHQFHSSSAENGLQEMDMMNSNSPNMNIHFMEGVGMVNKEDQMGNDKDSVKQEMGRADSVSDCSDQNEEEENGKYQRRNGKGPQSKNLVAERKRRKKLNDRLYNLRALVPNISKLDRASILGDAIEFVKDLQKQSKELQDELEDNSDEEGPKNNNNNSVMHSEIQNRAAGCKTEQDHKLAGGDHSKFYDQETTNDKTQQMEPQVEVWQIDGNEFFLKVFCEYKPGGFVRLMEALSSLGLVVTNANVTRFRGLVSNVFRVEMRDCEMIQADHVRDSLLELTRDGYRDMGKGAPENGGCNLDFHQHQQQQQQQQQQQHDIYNHGHMNAHHHHHMHRLHN